MRDKASVKRRSRTSLDLVLWSTRGGPRLERAGQKLLFRARRRPTGPPCATADGEAHWEGLPTPPLRAGGEHANCEELLLVAVVRMRKAGLTHREQCMQKRNRGSPQQHGSSGSQKQSALFKRQGLTQFTPDFVEWLTNESLEDTSMGMAMPRGRYGEEVWTSAFFDSVKVELDRRQQGTGIFVCAFDRTDGNNQPTGVTDIASRRLITLLIGPAYKVRDEKEALRKALTKSQRAANPSWLDTYRKVITCTAEDAPDLGLSFDELIDYSSAFHALTPITNAVFTARLAERLVRSGMVLDLCSILCDGQAHGTSGDIEASSFDLGKLAKYGFRSCTCKTFPHYLWCIHSCGDAKLRKLIKSWPATLDPTRLGDRRTGAIPNAVRGGALGRM